LQWNHFFDFSATDVFFLKVDRNGNITGSVGISEKMTQSEIVVYPNPAKSSINFNTGMYNDFQLTIYNSIGQTVLQKQCTTSQNTFTIQDFQHGMYY